MKTILVVLFALLASSHCTKSNPTDVNPAKISSVQLTPVRTPVFIGKSDVSLYTLKLRLDEGHEKVFLKKVILNFTPGSQPDCIASLSVVYTGTEIPLFGSSQKNGLKTAIAGTSSMSTGLNLISLNFTLKSDASLTKSFEVQEVELIFSDNQTIKVAPDYKFIYHPALLFRAAGQDRVNTYRIPGLITTGKGTLIAVYDNRYNNSKDLQEDIDIGMSRSTDGGQTWQPMKVIMDMGEYGGRSQQLNGIGDPCVLYDHKTNTIWVAALWMSGSAPDKMLWWASKPGMKPEETGQFILVKSTDDGATWSQPINITSQIKDPAWQLLLQGPGRGITMTDGTLVFPAQFKADLGTKALDGGQFTCHSTIVYSKDQGNTWQIGTGAKSNTTEAQVVELADGSLMLNMRDDRNRKDKGDTNGRAVSTTNDLGKTWTVHPSSNSALPESNCMGSIISADVKINGQSKQVLFFSNPNNKNTRTNMTIKASLDNGLTWSEAYQTELNSAEGYGYSCLTMVDENTIGIVYEGTKELYFQKIPVSDLLVNLVKK
ncbi:sialidase [Aquipluma nitroreducens]|uniref:exo-alpha-sialidase n=1 Tax=Aquipluma nitroreducens TaxID=2010828 RepID=A0A5K7SEW4_9BACT|nr:sialidase family protein [Aquipluma nitroreducens]BBE20172.1 sialidase [Aquipluma nitroreducens]